MTAPVVCVFGNPLITFRGLKQNSHVVHDSGVEDEGVEAELGSLELHHERPHRLERGEVELHERHLRRHAKSETKKTGSKQIRT